MKYSKKCFRFLSICSLIAIIAINIAVISTNQIKNNFILNSIAKVANAQLIEYPGPGQIGDLDPCVLVYPDGSFTSSVEYVCWDQYVCPSCTCTPIPCGQGW